MEFNISDERLDKLISGAVLEYLTPEKRDELIKLAVKALLSGPHPQAYSSKDKEKSVIQFLLERSLDSAMMKTFDAYWETDEGKNLLTIHRDAALGKLEDGEVWTAMVEGLKRKFNVY